ncbi:inositol monophosphatase family protein [Rhabdaerophilum calidifontis]|uniref:inositol monophosphatase family protein n=1 Tax=Rhabdaerophilum calidifontis TaxID=2604328 RepID=UPI0012389993|nr:inositol monophosphatase family protein [Rhabdaerophilum calidifontis]
MSSTRADLDSTQRLQALHDGLIALAREAGRLALRHYRPGATTTARIDWKTGGSPVTEADHAVDRLLAAELPRLAPLPIHSEERPEGWAQPAGGDAFVLDPIDGTRDFAGGGRDWCIVIGVLAGWRPIAGVVHMPATGMMVSAFRGGGAFRDGAPLAPPPAATPPRATGPRSIAEIAERRLGTPLAPIARIAPLAHRLLAPLTGAAEFACANPGAHDWDIVASDCILAEAGFRLATLAGACPDYRLKGGEQPALMAGSAALIEKIRPPLLTKPG